ncbi:small G protein signaling modulator 1 [Gadus chalcogrammus]|uniref:small G protein signaling modulator 1 n=1 Tax=Gadus chalcogrammus TaxID=1042646 RepID=UPI0024C22419|nr:small G protein signaling modulator 1 [Gadus chalcogrammus]
MGEAETRQKLLRNVKKEVKQIMEEAVTRKFVHADSSHIISFCTAVEACLLHGLRRRAAGLLCSNKVAALFMKVGKSFPAAEELCHKVQELEQLAENNKHNNTPLSNDRSRQSKPAHVPPQALRHLWIRTALMEKLLDKIVVYLVEHSSSLYDREAMLLDPVDGPVLASLLVGPCALEYTKVKTADHFWTDPSADELVQRHRIHSGHCRQESPSRRPALIQKRQSSGSMDDRPLMWARDYVESLHQNSRATLLFGKNNVLVQPRDDMEAIPGYLSLHQTADLMTLKWTPNQLMNGNVGELDSEKSVYWDFAMTIRLEEIVYLHCHQQVDSGGTVVLVSQDGIQRPPFHFPKGGHLLQFLTCLETGLLPHGQLDPPLWSQRGKGKVFPKLRKRSPPGSCDSVSDKEEEEATDYVFRLLLPGTQMEFVATEMVDPSVNLWHPVPRKSSCSSCSQSGSSDGSLPNGCNQDRAPLKLLCDTMKYQIISRAFYGWLAYCRHLSTVRIHLSALVNHSIVDRNAPSDARGGLSVEIWTSFLKDCSNYQEQDIYRLVYFGGVDPTLRKEVWPFLLGHYHFTMTEKCRTEVDKNMQTAYGVTMKEWQGCEAIVRQREREKHAEAVARCSSGASVEKGPLKRESTISTDYSQGSSSAQQNARSQSDSSSSTQVYGSVEDMDQMESEPRSEEGEVKDVKVDTADPKIPPPCDPSSPALSEKLQDLDVNIFVSGASVGSTVSQLLPGSAEPPGKSVSEETKSGLEITDTQPAVHQSHGENVPKTPAPKDITSDIAEVSGNEKVEGVSEVNTAAEGKCTEGEPLNKPELGTEKVTSPKTPVKVIPAGKTPTRAEPENMNVLTLEKEVHNEYFQAPLLGQSLALKAQAGKDLALSLRRTGDTTPDVVTADPDKSPLPTPTNEPEGEDTDADISELSEPKKDKPGELLYDRPGSDSPVRQVLLNALQTASRGSLSLASHCKQSSDTADSDDSPSALEMEDIPTGITCVSSGDGRPGTLISLAAPPLSRIRMRLLDGPASERVPVGLPDAGANTSPDGTEAGLSEDEEEGEPQMESLPTRQVAVEEASVVCPESSGDGPLSSSGESAYTQEQLDMYLLNLHRIDKDVRRCDRTNWYFTPANLEKLRNIMCSYVWKHLDIGYVQGMCDLLAPLLVILDDEVLTFSCFTELMKRMNQNFPHGGAMDSHFANMRSLIQILDSELFELMQQNGDYTHFYFCYRWFLLDFKREMVYDDVFSVWETIWAAKYTSSDHFVLFIALALVEMYRDIILENNMDFTDIIKFFNEMAEHHSVPKVLSLARDLVYKVQALIENK